MPIYEYVCKDCGSHFETIRSMKEADSTIPCKSCQSVHTLRTLSVFYAQSSGGKTIAGTNSGGCAGCSGGSCSSCRN